MVVGVLRFDLVIGDAVTLKDKRRVVKGLKDRLAGQFNVSIAEVEFLDARRRAGLAAAMVGTDRRFVESVLSKVVDHVRRCGPASLLDYTIELW